MELIKILFLRIRHFIFSKFLHYVVFHDGGFSRNQFGSIISPLERRIAWDANLQKRALLVRKYFHEVSSDTALDAELVRIGSANDGGYFLPADLSQVDGVISGGIGTDNNFEVKLGEKQINVMQFDPSIQQPPLLHPNLKFSKSYMNSRDVTLKRALEIFQIHFLQSIQNGLLKLDIEGSEWDLFSNADDANDNLMALRKFSILTIEFHDLGKIHDDKFWDKVEKTLNLLTEEFIPVFISGNNCREFVQIGGVPILDTLEVTYVRRTRNVPSLEVDNVFQIRNIPERTSLYSKAFTN